jgi:hypothetical protein
MADVTLEEKEDLLLAITNLSFFLLLQRDISHRLAYSRADADMPRNMPADQSLRTRPSIDMLDPSNRSSHAPTDGPSQERARHISVSSTIGKPMACKIDWTSTRVTVRRE